MAVEFGLEGPGEPPKEGTMIRMEGKILLAGLVIEAIIVAVGLAQVAQGAPQAGPVRSLSEGLAPVVVASGVSLETKSAVINGVSVTWQEPVFQAGPYSNDGQAPDATEKLSREIGARLALLACSDSGANEDRAGNQAQVAAFRTAVALDLRFVSDHYVSYALKAEVMCSGFAHPVQIASGFSWHLGKGRELRSYEFVPQSISKLEALDRLREAFMKAAGDDERCREAYEYEVATFDAFVPVLGERMLELVPQLSHASSACVKPLTFPLLSGTRTPRIKLSPLP